MAELSKYMRFDSVAMNRSEIKFADYNPRVITKEQRDTLKKGIKQYGLVGGIVVNKQTGNTLVSGHQRISVMDDLQHYDVNTQENDYIIKVELIDVDAKAEKELVILLNNPNAQGQFDWDKIGELVKDGIDWKNAGLTQADLSMSGIDLSNLFRTDEQLNIMGGFDDLMKEENERHAAEVAQRKEDRAMMKEQMRQEMENAGGESLNLPSAESYDTQLNNEPEEELSREEKIQRMKDLKQQVKEQAIERAMNESAYITLSFDDFESKMRFVEMFNLNPNDMMAKGEDVLFIIESMQE